VHREEQCWMFARLIKHRITPYIYPSPRLHLFPLLRPPPLPSISQHPCPYLHLYPTDGGKPTRWQGIAVHHQGYVGNQTFFLTWGMHMIRVSRMMRIGLIIAMSLTTLISRKAFANWTTLELLKKYPRAVPATTKTSKSFHVSTMWEGINGQNHWSPTADRARARPINRFDMN